MVNLVRRDRGYGWRWLSNVDLSALQIALQANYKMFDAGVGNDDSVRVLKKYARKHGIMVSIDDKRKGKKLRP